MPDPFEFLSSQLQPGALSNAVAPMPGPMPMAMPQIAQMPPELDDLPIAPTVTAESGPPMPMNGKGGIDWRELSRMLAPVIGMIASGPGSPRATGFAGGYQHGQQMYAQEQEKRRLESEKKKQQAAEFRLRVFDAAKEIGDPSEWAKFVDLATDSAMQMGFIESPAEMKSFLTYPSHLEGQQQREAALTRLEGLLKSGYDLDQLIEQGASVQISVGKGQPKTYKVKDLVTIAGSMPEAAGQTLTPPKPSKTTAPSDYEQSFARFLKGRGKTMETATSADEMEFKKQFNQADDKAPDPMIAELRGLNIEAARARLKSGSESTDLSNQLKQIQIDAAQQKGADAKQATDLKRTSAVRLADEMTAEIDQLLDPATGQLTAGARSIVGLRMPLADRVPGSAAANAKAALDRVSGQMVVNLMREMKEQSRTGATGFGSLTERELALLQGAASKLSNRNMSEAAFAAELKRIRDKLQLVHGAARPSKQTIGRFEVEIR